MANKSLLCSNAFARVLEAIPAEDWGRTWAANKTIMMSMTSKRVKEIMDKMSLPLAVNLKRLLGKNNDVDTIISHNVLVMKSFTEFLSKLNNKYKIISFDMRNIRVIYARSVRLSFIDMINMIGHCCVNTIKCIYINKVCNNVFGSDIKILTEVLRQCSELSHLELGGNNIGPDGVEFIAAMLPQLQALTYLDINDNDIGIDGAKSISVALPQCPKLTTLHIYKNNIQLAGYNSLEIVLPQCPMLTIFDISPTDSIYRR